MISITKSILISSVHVSSLPFMLKWWNSLFVLEHSQNYSVSAWCQPCHLLTSNSLIGEMLHTASHRERHVGDNGMIRQRLRTICIWLCVWHVYIGKHVEYNLVLGWCVILFTHCSNWEFAYESFLALLPSPQAYQFHI